MAKVTYLTKSQYNEVMSNLDTIYKICESYIAKWDKIYSLDSRVLSYSCFCPAHKDFRQIKTEKIEPMKDQIKRIKDFQNYIEQQQKRLVELDKELAGGGGDTGGGAAGGYDGYVPDEQTTSPASNPTTTPLEGAEDIHIISTTAFDDLTADQKTALRERLKELGFTDDEIKDILDGKMSVKKQTVDKFSTELDTLKDNKEFISKLEKVFGMSIYNEDGSVNQDRLALLMLMAGKGLGMDVDLSEGSAFSKDIDAWADKLEGMYKGTYPSIRRRILEKYGIDIFNDDGTIDKEKLALVRMMGGLDKEEFGLEEFMGRLPKTDPEWIREHMPTVAPTTPDTIPTVPDGPTNPTTPKPDTPTTPPTNAPTSAPTNPPPAPTSPAPSPTPGPAPTNPPQPASETQNRVAVSTEGTSKGATNANATQRMMKALAAGAAFSKSSASIPKIPGVATTKIIKTKGANVGVLAAAALVAGGSAAGGGIMLGKKFSNERFGPSDWSSLETDTQMTIESLMRNIGFSEDEIALLERANFKISSDELNNHKSKIEKATKDTIEVEESLLGQYGYSMFDSSGSVNKYLLFITMIIDGKNAMDSYNLYNSVNLGLTDPDDSDLGYSGISMQDYIDGNPEKEEEPKEESKKKPKMSLAIPKVPKDDLKLDSFEPEVSNEDSFGSYVSPELNSSKDTFDSPTSASDNIVIEDIKEPEEKTPMVVVPPMATKTTPKTMAPPIIPKKVPKTVPPAPKTKPLELKTNPPTPKTSAPIEVSHAEVSTVKKNDPFSMMMDNDSKDASEKGFAIADTEIPTIPPATIPQPEKPKYADEEAPKEWLKNIGIY